LGILIMLNAVKHSLAVNAAYRCRCARSVGLVWQIHHLKPARRCAPPEPQIFEFLGYLIGNCQGFTDCNAFAHRGMTLFCRFSVGSKWWFVGSFILFVGSAIYIKCY
jgi:hypothetical protein